MRRVRALAPPPPGKSPCAALSLPASASHPSSSPPPCSGPRSSGAATRLRPVSTSSAPRSRSRAARSTQGDPAVVSILINSSGGMSLCSGTLVGPNLVLSAHHCVADNTSTQCSANGFGALYPATDFRVTTSPTAAAQVFNGSGQLPAADGVTWWASRRSPSPAATSAGRTCPRSSSPRPSAGSAPSSRAWTPTSATTRRTPPSASASRARTGRPPAPATR